MIDDHVKLYVQLDCLEICKNNLQKSYRDVTMKTIDAVSINNEQKNQLQCQLVNSNFN